MPLPPRHHAPPRLARAMRSLLAMVLLGSAWAADEFVIGAPPTFAVAVSPSALAAQTSTVTFGAFGDAFAVGTIGTPFSFTVRWISNDTLARSGGGDGFVPASVYARLVAPEAISEVLHDLLALEFRSVGACEHTAFAANLVGGDELWDALAMANEGEVIGDEFFFDDTVANDPKTVAVLGRGDLANGVAELVGPARSLSTVAADVAPTAAQVLAAIAEREPIRGARCGSVEGTGQPFEARLRVGRWTEGSFVPLANPTGDVLLPAGTFPLRLEIRLVGATAWGAADGYAATDPPPPP